MGVKRTVGSFFAGIALTIILVVVVPIIVDGYVMGYVEQLVGDSEFLFLTSELIVTIIIWGIFLGAMVLLGAGGILKHFGAAGLVGLVVAYWLLGDVTDALLPLLILAAMLLVMWIHGKNKEKNAGVDVK